MQVAHMNVTSYPGHADIMRIAELLALQAGEPLFGALMASGATSWPLQGEQPMSRALVASGATPWPLQGGQPLSGALMASGVTPWPHWPLCHLKTIHISPRATWPLDQELRWFTIGSCME